MVDTTHTINNVFKLRDTSGELALCFRLLYVLTNSTYYDATANTQFGRLTLSRSFARVLYFFLVKDVGR